MSNELHNKIMNIPHGPLGGYSTAQSNAYLMGHRDARHAAAELVNESLAALVASAAPSGEREKFEAWIAKHVRESFPYATDEDIQVYLIRRLNEPENYLYYHQGWQAWQAAIAHQPPKEAMTDEQILDLWREFEDMPIRFFARAIEAASAPNKQLVDAPNMDDWNVQMACVKALLNCTDGELECTGLKLLDSYIEDVKRVVAAALAAAGVKGE